MHEDWCRSLFATLVDGGAWGIPRSGLLFRKEEEARRLVCVARMPHMKEMPITAAQLKEQQDGELAACREAFAQIGVEVEDRSNGQ